MRYLKGLVAISAVYIVLAAGAFADAWHIESVDTAGNVGKTTSIALDASDNPHISYMDYPNYDLKYAYYDGSDWQIEYVDTGGDVVGYYISIALDGSDNPHISYFDGTNGDLKYAYYDGADWQIEAVDTEGAVGYYTSIALDASDNPHISYQDYPNYDLKYAYYDGSDWQIEYVDTGGDVVGYFTSIALDGSDNPHISYYDWTNGDLKYAYYDGTAWQVESVDTAERTGFHTSIALDASDTPYISYFDNTNHDLKYAYYDGTARHDKFKGLIFVVYAAIGTRSEGPQYLLQVSGKEFFILRSEAKQHPWDWDWNIEYFSRRFVEVTGKKKAFEESPYKPFVPDFLEVTGVIDVEGIEDIGGTRFPNTSN